MTPRQQSRSEIEEWLAGFGDEGVLLADGFDDAFLGVAVRASQPAVAVYDSHRCIEIIMMRSGSDLEEAKEFFEFNTVGAWVGASTPLYLWRYES